jgi:hypothetical protein
MIDTDKYERHTQGHWATTTRKGTWVVYTQDNGDVATMNDYEDAKLIAAAPLLLAEVKRLRKQLEDCKRQIQFTADWIRDRGEDTHAKELDEFLEWME